MGNEIKTPGSSICRQRFKLAPARWSLPAVEDLTAALAQGRRYGFADYELEARLALGEIEMKSGNPAAARRGSLGAGLIVCLLALAISGAAQTTKHSGPEQTVVAGSPAEKSPISLPGLSPFLPNEILYFNGDGGVQAQPIATTNNVETTLRGPANLGGFQFTLGCDNSMGTETIPAGNGASSFSCTDNDTEMTLTCSAPVGSRCFISFLP